MRNTKVVWKFESTDSIESVTEQFSAWSLLPRPILAEFCASRGLSENNIVSETINHETQNRTVIRSWPDLETATAFVEACGGNGSIHHFSQKTDFSIPGVMVEVTVVPE